MGFEAERSILGFGQKVMQRNKAAHGVEGAKKEQRFKKAPVLPCSWCCKSTQGFLLALCHSGALFGRLLSARVSWQSWRPGSSLKLKTVIWDCHCCFVI